LPTWAKWTLAAYLAGFAEGFGDHVRWMSDGGIHAYAHSYPQVPIQVFFVALAVLDPLVVALVGFVRREGVRLAVAVMAVDIAANWIGNWARIVNNPARLAVTAPWVISLFGLFVFATARPLLRAMQADGQLLTA
jgi:hypothetical protein